MKTLGALMGGEIIPALTEQHWWGRCARLASWLAGPRLALARQVSLAAAPRPFGAPVRLRFTSAIRAHRPLPIAQFDRERSLGLARVGKSAAERSPERSEGAPRHGEPRLGEAS